MQNQSIDLPRSILALVAGNLVAIVGSAVIAMLLCSIFFPEFFDRLAHKGDSEKTGRQVDGDQKDQEQEAAKQNKEQNEPDSVPIGFQFVILTCDIVFCILGGITCVLVSRSSQGVHAVLLAVVLVAWKLQQLLDVVPNQIPFFLVLAEVVICPIACLIGASFYIDSTPTEEINETSSAEETLSSPHNQKNV